MIGTFFNIKSRYSVEISYFKNVYRIKRIDALEQEDIRALRENVLDDSSNCVEMISRMDKFLHEYHSLRIMRNNIYSRCLHGAEQSNLGKELLKDIDESIVENDLRFKRYIKYFLNQNGIK